VCVASSVSLKREREKKIFDVGGQQVRGELESYTRSYQDDGDVYSGYEKPTSTRCIILERT